MKKLNTLLGLTSVTENQFSALVKDYLSFFKKEQGAFKGEKKTYEPASGTADIPGQRSNKLVVTTVTEKLNWLREQAKDYIDNLFTIEATNASGVARAELIVDGVSWGEYSSLELLRLKSILENGDFVQMYSAIPTRSETENWSASTNPEYEGREVFQNLMVTGENSSTVKETIILDDPNISKLKDTASYSPVTGTRDTVIKLGDYTLQRFSGEWTHVQRAAVLNRRNVLLKAVVVALKEANDNVVVSSAMTAEKLFNYLHEGK